MKRILIGLLIGLGLTAGTAVAQTVFRSLQVGSGPAAGEVLQTNGTTSTWVATSTLGLGAGGAGSVTSVDMTVPTGLSISGNPVTGTGTLAVTLQAGYNIPLTASTTSWNNTAATSTTGQLLNYNWSSFWNSLNPLPFGSYLLNSNKSTIATTTYQFEDFLNYTNRWTSTSGGSIAFSNGTMTVTTPAGNDVIALRTLWSNILRGFDTISFDLNFNGNTFLTASDTPVISFDQSGDKGVQLTNFATNGSSAWQSVTLPLAKFTANLDSTSTTTGTGTALVSSSTVTNFKIRAFENDAGKTLSIRNVVLSDYSHTLKEDFTQPDLISRPKYGNSLFRFQGMDFMKVSKDNLAGQYTNAQMSNLVAAMKPFNLTHIAVSIPYDNCADYPSPCVDGYQTRWANAIRAGGYNVFWRQHWNGWEGDYSFSKTATSTVPLGTAAGVLNGSDTTSYLYKNYNYILTHASQYAPGDFITPTAEPENGGINGIVNCTGTCQFGTGNEFRQYLMDGITVTNAALDRIGLKGRVHVGYYGNSGFIVWGNGDNLNGFLDDRVADAMRIVSVDHYPNPVTDITTDLGSYERIYNQRPLIVTEFGTINDTTTTTKESSMNTVINALKLKPYIHGLNYWSATAGSNEDVIDEASLNVKGGGGALIAQFTSGSPQVVANALGNRGTYAVSLASSAPPILGQVLMASTSTHASWGNLLAGSNITITTSTAGQITIAASGGGSGNSAWTILSGVIHNATSTDEVGIGTATPDSTLTLQGNGAINPLRIASSTGTTMFQIAPNASITVASLTAAACDVKSTTGGSLYCGTDATGAGGGDSAWTIGSGVIYNSTSTDEVGIGTSTPQKNLHIYSSSIPYLVLTNTSASSTATTSAQNLAISNESNGMYIGGYTNDYASSTSYLRLSRTGQISFEAGNGYTTGNSNTILGVNAGPVTGWDGYSTFGGAYPNGIGFTAIGHNAMRHAVLYSNGSSTVLQAYANTAVGQNAMYNVRTGSENTAVGYAALPRLTTANGNTAIGVDAGFTLTTGVRNTIVGTDALTNSSEGNLNVMMGVGTGQNLVTGSGNTYLGTQAGQQIQDSDNSVIIGYHAAGYAGNENVSANINENVIIGTEAAQLTTSSQSTIIGYRAGRGDWGQEILCNVADQSGCGTNSNNIFLGYRSGSDIITGSNNLLLGYQAGRSLRTGSNNIMIGYNTDLATNTANTLSIGNLLYGTGLTSFSATSTLVSAGRIGVGTSTPIAKLSVQASSTDATIPIFTLASSTGSTLFQVAANGSTTISSLTAADCTVKSTTGGSLYCGTGSGGAGTASGTAGAIQFSDGAAGFDANEAAFVWDNTNKRLGISSSSPARSLVVAENGSNDNGIFVEETGTNGARFIVGSTVTSLTGGIGLAEFDFNASNIITIGAHGASVTPGVSGYHSRGTRAAPTATQLGDILFSVLGRGYGTTTYSTSRGLIGINAEANWLDNDQSAYIRFNTTAASSTTLTEQMRITGAGRVGIGTTTPSARLSITGSTTMDALDVSSSSGASLFRVALNGNVGINTSTPNAKFAVAANCSLFSSTTPPGGRCTDLAEIYPSSEPVAMGQIVSIDGGEALVKKSDGAYDNRMIGIVSSQPAIVIEGNSVELMNGADYKFDPLRPAIALAGRVPVQVLGDVEAGDFVTSSDEPGFGMKATHSGQVIGQAIQDSVDGMVMVFVKPGYQAIGEAQTEQGGMNFTWLGLLGLLGFVPLLRKR